MDETKIYDSEEFTEANIILTLKEVIEVLEERGYNPINQIVGFLLTNDPGYISSYKDARKKMLSIDRASIVAILLKGFLK